MMGMIVMQLIALTYYCTLPVLVAYKSNLWHGITVSGSACCLLTGNNWEKFIPWYRSHWMHCCSTLRHADILDLCRVHCQYLWLHCYRIWNYTDYIKYLVIGIWLNSEGHIFGNSRFTVFSSSIARDFCGLLKNNKWFSLSLVSTANKLTQHCII